MQSFLFVVDSPTTEPVRISVCTVRAAVRGRAGCRISLNSTTMKLLAGRVKEAVRAAYKPVPAPAPPTGPHNTPAGQYPSEGPQPGKLGLVFYCASLVLSIFGIFVLVKCPQLQVDSSYKLTNFFFIVYRKFTGRFPCCWGSAWWRPAWSASSSPTISTTPSTAPCWTT